MRTVAAWKLARNRIVGSYYVTITLDKRSARIHVRAGVSAWLAGILSFPWNIMIMACLMAANGIWQEICVLYLIDTIAFNAWTLGLGKRQTIVYRNVWRILESTEMHGVSTVLPDDCAKHAQKKRDVGAGDRGRTGDVQLGKLAFYH